MADIYENNCNTFTMNIRAVPFSIRLINYRLWFAIFLTAFIPTLYSTVRIYFLNSLPDTWSVSIAAQAAWLGLIYEIVQEALLLPLYYLFGKAIGHSLGLRDRVTTSLAVTLNSP